MLGLLCFLAQLKEDIENYCNTCLSWDLLSPDIANKEALRYKVAEGVKEGF